MSKRNVQERRASSIVCAEDSGEWVDRELANGQFKDARLGKRFRSLLEQLSSSPAGPILVLHVTTELTYHREDGWEIGHLGTSQIGSTTRPLYHKVCGILTHSSLAVAADGLPLGLAAIKFWARENFNGSSALKRHINPTRVPIEYKEDMCLMDNLRQSTAAQAMADTPWPMRWPRNNAKGFIRSRFSTDMATYQRPSSN